MTRTRSLFAATVLALSAPLAIAACGSDDEGSSDADPQEVVDATLNNDEQVTSGVIDLSVDASAGDQGSFTLSLSGPFQGVEDDPTALPQLDLTASVSGEGAGQSVDFEGGIVVTEDNAFVEYGGQTYEVGADAFASLQQSIEASVGPGRGVNRGRRVRQLPGGLRAGHRGPGRRSGSVRLRCQRLVHGPRQRRHRGR